VDNRPQRNRRHRSHLVAPIPVQTRARTQALIRAAIPALIPEVTRVPSQVQTPEVIRAPNQAPILAAIPAAVTPDPPTLADQERSQAPTRSLREHNQEHNQEHSQARAMARPRP
jgi:hypothetical protein